MTFGMFINGLVFVLFVAMIVYGIIITATGVVYTQIKEIICGLVFIGVPVVGTLIFFFGKH